MQAMSAKIEQKMKEKINLNEKSDLLNKQMNAARV